jgi:pyruvate formate lyase activating enzyme
VNVNLKDIRKSIEIIKKSGIDYEFRTTVVPGIHSREDIIAIAKEISPAQTYFLQNFRPEKTLDPKFEKLRPYSNNFLSEIKKEIQNLFQICGAR